jgi:hypothetical protein
MDFVVRMTMGSWTTPGEGAEEEHGDVHIAVVGPDEVVRAALKRQVLLTNAVHPADAPGNGWDATEARRTTSQDTTGPSNRNFGRRRSDASLRAETASRTRQI